MLQEKFGKSLSARELSGFLGLSYQTILANYKKYGGRRLSPKRIIFFEQEVIRALEAEGRSMGRPGQECGEPHPEAVSEQGGGDSMGERQEARTRRQLEDPFGIFSWRAGK